MKKLMAILLAIFTVVTLSGCQKSIDVSINYSDPNGGSGGMRAQLSEKSTLKDLFDELSKGTDFVYELDSDGYVTSINGKGNDEFGYWEILLNGDVLNDTIGKIAIGNEDVCDITYIPNMDNAIVGGWETPEVAREDLAEDEKEIFDKAFEGFTGVGYEPVCVLATQVVSGTNYAYLARATTVTAEPVSFFSIVKIYKDLNGNVELTSIADINLLDIATKENSDENLLGGWTITDTGKPGTLGSAEAQSSFEKAVEELIGQGYNPVQLLGRQVVAGTNYIALARGKVVGSEGAPELYIISWYEDLEGNSTITDVRKFDLGYYVQ